MFNQAGKLLILGGNGFIGGHVTKMALTRGFDVTIFDRRRLGQNPRITAFLGDIRDREAVQEAVRLADYAINLAGILGTQETIGDPIPSIQTNLIGAVNFLGACVPSGFHKVRGVQIGVGNYWMQNSYSITKSSAIRFVEMYNREHGTQVAMVRALNAYGEGQKAAPVRKIIPTFVLRALAGKDIEVYGDGLQIMDMIYVDDVAGILLDACTSPRVCYNKIYQAGTGRRLTVKQIAEKVIEATGSKSHIVNLPMRPGETEGAVVLGDPGTLEDLGDYNLMPFEEGIQHTVRWYRRQIA
jgi:nucleoside-diphosphate-sugar epimerase